MSGLRASKLTFILLTSILLIMARPVTATAQDLHTEDETELELFDSNVERNRAGWVRFQLTAGVTRMDADGVFSVSQPQRPPVTIIDFDRVGLKETDSSHWFSATWRSAQSRWGIWFANWRYDVTGQRIWEDELSLPRVGEIPVGARVQSDFDANWYVIEGTWSFVQTETIDMGVGLGIHTVDLDTNLAAEVSAGDSSVEVVHGSVDTLAPLPNVMGYLYWKPGRRWNFVARYGWFGLDLDKYSGRMTNSNVLLSFAVSERVSIGAGYQYIHLDVDVDEDRYTQIYDINFDGPLAVVRFRF